MANDLNQCNFTGRLGADPEARYTANGTAVTNFRIACGESFKDQQGQKQEKTEWINCVSWKQLAELASKYLEKGSFVRITGKYTTRKWQDRDGADRYSTEIVVREMQFLGGGSGGQQRPPQQAQQQRAPQQAPPRPQPQQAAPSGAGYPDEQLPFDPGDEIPF